MHTDSKPSQAQSKHRRADIQRDGRVRCPKSPRQSRSNDETESRTLSWECHEKSCFKTSMTSRIRTISSIFSLFSKRAHSPPRALKQSMSYLSSTPTRDKTSTMKLPTVGAIPKFFTSPSSSTQSRQPFKGGIRRARTERICLGPLIWVYLMEAPFARLSPPYVPKTPG